MKNFKPGLLAALLLSGAFGAQAQALNNTWTGGVSTDWNTPGNWSAGRVPLGSDNVIIQGPSQALFNPYVNGPVAANDLTLTTGAVLYLQNTGLLTVYGNIANNNGSLVGVGRGAVMLKASFAVQRISGPTRTTFHNLTVGSAGAITAGPVAIERGLTVMGNLTVGTGQDLTIQSTSTGPGYVVNAGGVVIGPVTVQRYIDPSLNPGLGYRHLTSPVQNATFNTLVGPGFTPVFNAAYNTAAFPRATRPFPTVYGYNQDRLVTQAAAQGLTDFEKGWFSPNGNDRMTPGTGYTIDMPGAANGVSGPGRVVSFTGTLTDGNLTVPLARGPRSGQGLNLLGNPYPSPLDWNRVIADPNTRGISTALYVFKSGGQYSGSFATYNNGVGTNGGTNVLPLGQGFFALCLSPTGTVAYTNAQRLTSDSTLLQRGPASTPLNGARVLVSGPAGRCEAVVSFAAGATTGFDATHDALSIPAGALRVATQTPGNDLLAINGLPVLGSQPVAVPLTIWAGVAGNYQLSRTEGQLPAGFAVYLLDALTGHTANLSTGPAVSVALGAGQSPAGRFVLLFSAAAPLSAASPLAAAGAALYPNPTTGSVFVQLSGRSGPATVEIVNVLGQQVLSRELPAGTTAQRLLLDGISPGVYSVRLTTAAGLVAQRLVIK